MASTTATATPTRRSARTSTSTNGTNPRTRKSPTSTARRTTAATATASKVKTPGPETAPTTKNETYDQTELGGNKVTVSTEKETPKTTHQFLLMSGGSADFLVHTTGCKRVPVDLKKSQYDTPYGFSPESREAAIRDLWTDQIREAWDGPKDDTPSLEWLRDHGYVDSVNFHSCVKLDALPKPPKVDAAGQKRAAKTELATRCVEAIAAMVKDLPADNPVVVALGGPTEAAKCAAHWVHHLPADRDRWVAAGLPKPDRSDWR